MDYLKFHTEELPLMAEAGARYVVVACCGDWRDGEVTNSRSGIPQLQRELRKRFMNRLGSAGARRFKAAISGSTRELGGAP